MVTSINQLLSEDLPAMMDATYTSLITAQQSAGAIDGVLTTLSSIPLIGIPYNPEVPLGSALGDVADKVSGLPARFIEMSSEPGYHQRQPGSLRGRPFDDGLFDRANRKQRGPV